MAVDLESRELGSGFYIREKVKVEKLCLGYQKINSRTVVSMRSVSEVKC